MCKAIGERRRCGHPTIFEMIPVNPYDCKDANQRDLYGKLLHCLHDPGYTEDMKLLDTICDRPDWETCRLMAMRIEGWHCHMCTATAEGWACRSCGHSTCLKCTEVKESRLPY
ncbi:hypothetical protein N7478_007549 [Penicillium angulare]|uniref:uncharacterized protein n=1 Tax=Penicillium angulare TaxID=116970 RepID=UPI0025422A42|nr:uncharacterized protein N7478_007549 [Penicillium angulare]KAJ5272424.1 hypothetical protein N7478_007549 [Penicillium angulare]